MGHKLKSIVKTAIVLDVKCGSGAFMKDYDSAKELAVTMADIGRSVGREVTAVISSMDQPLGMNIGNSLEVIEAIEILKGNVAGDLLDVALTLGAHMLMSAKKVATEEDGKAMLLENIKNGKGLEKFRELIIQQKGNPDILDDYSLLPISPEKEYVYATIPKSKEIKEQILDILSDGEEHRTRDIKRILAKNTSCTQYVVINFSIYTPPF